MKGDGVADCVSKSDLKLIVFTNPVQTFITNSKSYMQVIRNICADVQT